jgi:hypothetical protein
MARTKSSLRATTSELVGAEPPARVGDGGDAAIPEMEGDEQEISDPSASPDRRELLRQSLLADWLNRQELAAALGVKERTISEWIARPDGLPHAVVGKRYYFRIDLIREWLERRIRVRNATKSRAQRQRAGR